ncbi:MAG: hypothetical protein IPL73_24280 [Candidatus Obscuribacter sp.]|nr:hypothetical protein [Candidatus Obscuribacter sp.]
MTDSKIKLQMSDAIRQKLKEKHDISEEQVQACFLNRERGYLFDDREEHKTDPPTRWFIAEDDTGKLIKVCFIYFPEDRAFEIKTAYPPNETEIRNLQDCTTRHHRENNQKPINGKRAN